MLIFNNAVFISLFFVPQKGGEGTKKEKK